MQLNKEVTIITDCLDILVDAPFLSTKTDQCELAQSIIEILVNYPQPKETNTPIPPQHIGAYLYTSTIQSVLKLAKLNYIPFDRAFALVSNFLEASLSLLIDNK